MNRTPYRSIWQYYWNAKTKYSLHSPFVFDFFNTIMNVYPQSELIQIIEKERATFLHDSSELSFVDYGAGSKSINGITRRVSNIAKSSLSSGWQCRLIYNLIKRYQPANILEIGTSLGVSAAYMASASDSSSIVTLEGNPASAEMAESLFNRLGLNNIKLIEGEFGKTLSLGIDELEYLECAFIDGNHRKEATLEYFFQILPYTNKNSFIIIDDIYWSEGMNQAWREIIAHESVAFSIDVFRMGIVFLDHSIMEKQHFKLIDTKWKLWSIGIFG